MYNCIKGLRPVPWLKSPVKNRNDTISASSILGARVFYDFSVERVKQFCFSPLSICRSFKFFVSVMVCACVQCVYSLDNNLVCVYTIYILPPLATDTDFKSLTLCVVLFCERVKGRGEGICSPGCDVYDAAAKSPYTFVLPSSSSVAPAFKENTEKGRKFVSKGTPLGSSIQ